MDNAERERPGLLCLCQARPGKKRNTVVAERVYAPLLLKEYPTGRLELTGGLLNFLRFFHAREILKLVFERIIPLLAGVLGTMSCFFTLGWRLDPGGNLILLLLCGFLELAKTLSEGATDFREPLCSKDKKNNNENYQKFLHAKTKYHGSLRALAVQQQKRESLVQL